MVVSTSLSANNGSIHENEKRRKQTVERARVNHLSRQLQMRLQYAKLKVDHGWQKQNLNEVENLYFHHSHQRIPKPLASPPMITTTLNEPSTTHSNSADLISNSSLSSLSSRIQPSSLTRNTISPSQNETTSSASASQFTSTNNASLSSQSTSPVPTNPVEMRNLVQLEVEPEHKLLPSPTPATLPSQYPEPTPGPSRIPGYGTANYSALQTSFDDHAPLPTTTTWVTSSSRPPPTSSPSNFNHHPTSLQRTPTLPVSPGLSESSFIFPGVSLTYDSFWSSHSSSASSRSLRTSLSSIVPVAPGSVDSNGGMTDIFMFKSYQTPEPATARGSQGVGVRATAGKD